MTETTSLRDRLLPELQQEFENVRRIIEALPEGHGEYKPAEKSMSFSRLAGHTAELPIFISTILTSPDLDFATSGYTPHFFTTRAQLLAEFNELADKALTDFKNTSDEALDQSWKLSFKGHTIFSGTRYQAYRNMGLNHLVHHRGQLTVYLRLLGAKVPGLYGPSADEAMGAS